MIEQSWAEPERFEAIFRRYFGQIHRYLAARVGGRIADDLAAEVFTIAFAQRQRYDLARNCARPWLYGIATNLARQLPAPEQRRYRALARAWTPAMWHPVMKTWSLSGSAPPLPGRPWPPRWPGWAAASRDVLLLVAVAGLDNQEVALSLGIPYGTVRSRLSRARARLREALGGSNPAGSYGPADVMRPAGGQEGSNPNG